MTILQSFHCILLSCMCLWYLLLCCCCYSQSCQANMTSLQFHIKLPQSLHSKWFLRNHYYGFTGEVLAKSFGNPSAGLLRIQTSTNSDLVRRNHWCFGSLEHQLDGRNVLLLPIFQDCWSMVFQMFGVVQYFRWMEVAVEKVHDSNASIFAYCLWHMVANCTTDMDQYIYIYM